MNSVNEQNTNGNGEEKRMEQTRIGVETYGENRKSRETISLGHPVSLVPAAGGILDRADARVDAGVEVLGHRLELDPGDRSGEVEHKVFVSEEKVRIPTYPEADAEPLPMFAENRVHQRTSGHPYPNCVVLTAQRSNRVERSYRLIRLENEYLSIGILPELGGRIYWAKDKTTGYDFFYRQHVIKPALIGALGSWISGGVEFNFPFHHRPSTFMPVDCAIERDPDGGVTVWLSEHDPIDRMKGMVGVRLRPGEAMLETRVQVSNRTPVAKSFLWWENAAVPVNKDYEVFFPPDVSYVNFHYHRSVTTWPLASGVFNGMDMGDNLDLRRHKNTRSPTSYFSAASRYDFFGGYDHGKGCGVVHVANHHVSPGKKLFTWAYNQLSRSWEQALTDVDGPYAELMAGSYSDNQPDFAWIEPFETKRFSQYWYPIGDMGVPTCANTRAAIHVQRDSKQIAVAVQSVRPHRGARIRVLAGDKPLGEHTVHLSPGKPSQVSYSAAEGLLSVEITTASGDPILSYAEIAPKAETIPEPWTDLPPPEEFTTAQELHLAGVHAKQYRSPNALPDAYWKAALERDPHYAPALIDLGGFRYEHGFFDEAEQLLRKAIAIVTRHNHNPRNGELFYLLGLTLLAQGAIDDAYDAFYKAAWSESQRSRAFTMLASIDGRRKDFSAMASHADQALECAADNPLAGPLAAAAQLRLGNVDAAVSRLKNVLARDPLNHLAQYLLSTALKRPLAAFFKTLSSSPSQTCLDLAYDLWNAGLNREASRLLEELPSERVPMVCYTLGVLCLDDGDSDQADVWFARAEQASLGRTYPFRLVELKVLHRVLEHNPLLGQARYCLGCLFYDKGHYEEAAGCWQKAMDAGDRGHAVRRNMAVACFSHLNRKADALAMLKSALAIAPDNLQLAFELAHVMAKMGIDPAERAALLGDWCEREQTRDDVVLEYARTLNQMSRSEESLDLLQRHRFIPCEGGEHAVAEQYMFAHHHLGRRHLREGRCEEALAHFQKAQFLPDGLGAGLWHKALLAPHQYYEAICLRKMDRADRANDIFRSIIDLPVEYFSEMHLPELPVYQAMAMRQFGQDARADRLLRSLLSRWTAALAQTDAGWFKTTPFFISYIDSPRLARTAHFRYLRGMAKSALSDRAGALDDLCRSVECDPSQLYPWMEREFCQR